MNRQVHQVSLDFKKSAPLNLHVRMPALVEVPAARSAAAPVADRVTGKSQWNPADVPNAGGFFLKKTMLPPCGKNREEPIMTKILQVCHAKLLASGPCSFRYGDAVFLDELAIDDLGILASCSMANAC